MQVEIAIGPGPQIRVNRKAFTLIELLIVVVIIGILAAIAIPKFASTKDKSYVATMKADLRNFATHQEGYAADSGCLFLRRRFGGGFHSLSICERHCDRGGES